MSKARYFLFPLFLLICLMFTPTTLAAPAAEGNFTRYIPEAAYRDGMSPEEIEQAAHTIYWAQGIKPPAMPHTLNDAGSSETMGEFRLIDGDNYLPPEQAETSQKMFQYYIAPYQPGSGWYDVKKAAYHDSNPEESRLDGVDDSSMCYAAASANLVQWWLDQNRDLITRYVELLNQNQALIPAAPRLADPREADTFYMQPGLSEEDSHKVKYNPVFRQMRKAFSTNDHGSFPDLAMDFFFNGYALTNPDGPPNISGVNFVPDSRGGFFYPAFENHVITNRLSTQPSFSYMNTMLKRWLNEGIGISVSYLLNGSGHAITLWGAEYDEQGTLCAMYVVDNNMGSGNFGVIHGERHMYSMMRYQALNFNNQLILSTKKNTHPIGQGTGNALYLVALVDLAREPLEYFLEHQTQMPLPDGQKNYFPKDLAPPAYDYEGDHKHHYIFAAKGNTIQQVCDIPGCGKVKGWVEVVISDPGPFVYTGRAITPAYRTYFKGNWDGGTNVQFEYKDNLHAGTGSLSFRIQGQTAHADFSILPAPMPGTTAQPELAAAPTSHSIALKPIEGHEFSYDGEHWQKEGLFLGLQSGQKYTFSVRRSASDTDHSPALSPHQLTVMTAAGEPEAPEWSIQTVSLSDGEVTITLSNPGQGGPVTLVAAEYDQNGRMISSLTRDLPESDAGTISIKALTVSPYSHQVKAFLMRDHVPICASKSSFSQRLAG